MFDPLLHLDYNIYSMHYYIGSNRIKHSLIRKDKKASKSLLVNLFLNLRRMVTKTIESTIVAMKRTIKLCTIVFEQTIRQQQQHASVEKYVAQWSCVKL